MFLDYLTRWTTNDVAIDLGTANTLIYVKGQGIVLNEPSVVALEKYTKRVIAIGTEAKAMVGKTPEAIETIRPLKDGVIADFEVTEEMLRYFILKVQKRRFLVKPRIIICVPSGITEVEKRAVRDAAEHAGAREVYLVPEPTAAAIGVDLPIHEPAGNMIIDIGGGTTEIAVIALSGIVRDISLRIAGDEMDQAIGLYLKKSYNLAIGYQTSEEIKKKIGSAYPLKEELQMEVKGRDLLEGIPRTLLIRSEEIREALKEPVSQIIDGVRRALEDTPSELSADIVDRGIVMTGGGSQLRGLDRCLREETGLPVNVVENSLSSVVLGTGKILDNIEKYEKVLIR